MTQRFDLNVKAVNPHSMVLGRWEAVENPPSDGELAALGDLRNSFVASRCKLQGGLIKID